MFMSAPARSAPASRITSYNVCYTKLLRSIRFYAAMPEAVQHSPAVEIGPGMARAVNLPWQDSPFAAGESFFPLGIAAITVNQRRNNFV